MHYHLKVTIGLAPVLLVALVGCARVPRTDAGDVPACQLRLSNAVFVVKTYQADNNGSLPTNLVEVLKQYGGGGAGVLMTCPSRGRRHKPQSPSDWDYVYVDWPRLLSNQSPPSSFPLFYEIRLQDHAGKGVNVALVNGTVFFDYDGKFIKDFIASHADFGLSPPH